MSHHTVDDYGWRWGDSYSTRYLGDRVREICRRLRPRRVLDLGCGNGSLTRHLAKDGYQMVGCDADPGAIEIAKRRVSGAKFKVVSVYDDPSPLGQEKFDLVLAAEVIEHLFSPRALLSFSKQVLRHGGHLVITTPYHGYLKNLAISILNRWDDHHGSLEDGGHIKFFSKRSLTRLVRDSGLDPIYFCGAGRLPWFWKSMILVGRLPRNASRCLPP